jgi:RNA recognition motif-containing protein
VKRKTPLTEEANKTYKDADGEEYFMCTVFVGDIGPDVKEYHLEDAFSSFGPILSARIINEKPYGFVKFTQRDHADRAIATMNGYLLRG